jgi:hypothetical protein
LFASCVEIAYLVTERGTESALGLELSIDDGFWLSYQLVHPRLGNSAMTSIVYIDTVSSAGDIAIDEHANTRRSSWFRRSHYEMETRHLFHGLANVTDVLLESELHSAARPRERSSPSAG